MFSSEAVTQAVGLWLGAAAIGLALALVIAMLSQRGDEHAAPDAHDEQDHHA